MSYLSFIIALIQFLNRGGGEGVTFYQGLDTYLDIAVSVELFFLKLSGVGLVVALLLFLLLLFKGKELGATCGCYLLALGVIWPILEVVTYFIATGLASSVDPMVGIVNPTKFWLLVILMALLGAG